jgi:hypothetical protein
MQINSKNSSSLFIFIASMQKSYFPINKFIVTFLITLLAHITAKATEPVVHVSPKPTWISACKPYNQKPSLRTVEGGYFFELVEHQVQVEKQADYHHIIKEIVSEAGIQNGSEISISFDPSFERLDFHEITVWRDNKPQSRLTASVFKILADEKELSDFIYQGTYSALCILNDIRKGDRIEYSYTITGRNPIFHDKFCDELYFQWYQTVEHQYTSLIFSSRRKLNMKSFNGVSKPKISQAKGSNKYEWEDFQVMPALYDDTEPSWYDARAYVQVSDYNSWAEVTNWALSINPAKIDIKGDLAVQIAKLKATSGNDKEKYFRGAVKTVQDEVRYMGIEIGQYSHRANDPEKVFNQRYGDCKDKSLLLVSMLRAGGIDANMVLANTEMGSRIDQFIPGHNVFNHAVVVAVLNGKQVWVDATIDYQRGIGTAIWFPDYGKGLVLKPGNAGLTTIPVSEKGKIICLEKFTVKNGRSPVDFEVKTIYNLNEADKIRGRLASAGMAETEKNYLKYYAKTYNKIESSDSITVIDDEQKNVLTTIERYKISDFFKKDSVTGANSADFYAEFIKDQLPAITNQTKTPVDVNYPFNEDYTIKVIMPFGWNITGRENSIKRDVYQFSSDYSASEDTLSLNYKFTYLKDYVPVVKIEEFKKDIKELTDNALSYAISYTPLDTGTNSNINQWMLNFCLIIILILGIIAVFIYRRETPGIAFSYGTSFTPIGGWLILIGIGLFLMPIVMIQGLINNNYLNINTWNHYDAVKGGFLLKVQLIFNVAGIVVIMCYAVFCLVLLLNKRDILPKYIIGFFSFRILFRIAEYILIVARHRTPSSKFMEYGIITIIVSAVWIAYFLKSTRVEETFIVPHPSHNYTYDGPPEIKE